MKHPKSLFRGLAGLAVCCAAPSFAIPLVFDFAGSVQTQAHFDALTGIRTFDDAAVGQVFTAQLVIDTDRFVPGTVTDNFSFRDLFIPTGIGGTSPWMSSLSIGGNAIDVGIYDLNYAYVELQDTKNPAVGDSLLVVARSDLSGPLGVTNSSLLQLVAFETYSAGQALPGYIDLDLPFDMDSLLTVALPNLRLGYGTSSFDCQAVNLCFFAASDSTDFLVTSVTRSVRGATDVPEPGTFGLFAGAMLGMWIFARRRPALTSDSARIRKMH
ncbi:MAG TPA: PEP-CTERM sorting domain-containing protein [Steroidobacteraceae bacterium]|nr:PEP-CTERM sorting domain-containing protein [Steroidobacteraceae bacterium]